MKLDFRLDNITVTEFGVGLDSNAEMGYVGVPTNDRVKDALREMVRDTWNAMRQDTEEPPAYDPGETHVSTEYSVVSADGQIDGTVRELHDAGRLDLDGSALDRPECILCYFARYADESGRRLTAMRRASQFKGILKPRKVHIRSDTLELIEENIFKLDVDFDFLMDSAHTHIWRPSGFEFVAGLKQEILDAVPKNVASIQADLPFVDFGGVEEYACKHSRAARYLASIRAQSTRGISRDALKALCSETGVEIVEQDGTVSVGDAHVIGFLEVLDRRRYRVDLVPGLAERFKAASRRRIDR